MPNAIKYNYWKIKMKNFEEWQKNPQTYTIQLTFRSPLFS